VSAVNTIISQLLPYDRSDRPKQSNLITEKSGVEGKDALYRIGVRFV
jgi:hypothetical protein